MLPKWLIALLMLLQEAWSTRRDTHSFAASAKFLRLSDARQANSMLQAITEADAAGTERASSAHLAVKRTIRSRPLGTKVQNAYWPAL